VTSALTGNALLIAAVRDLKDADVPDAARDARKLLAFAAGIDAARLTLILPEPIEPDIAAQYWALIGRRAQFEPVSHLTGTRDFYGRAFAVTGDVLDPRPDTETLIGAALDAPFARVLDLGTGSGCILITLLAENGTATGVGGDASVAALAVAARNAQALGIAKRAVFVQSDWCDAIEGQFDLIVSNPPYIAADEMAGLSADVREWEPRMALTDEADGLSAYRTIVAQAGQHLQPGGRLMFEIGPSQGAVVVGLMVNAGYVEVAVIPDLDGRNRVVVGQMPALDA
jgi:release factor glutamine methyltransferase